MAKYKTLSFKGGYRFKRFLCLDGEISLQRFEPKSVSIAFGNMAVQVRQGHFVRKGDRIASKSNSDGNDFPVFASMTGRVTVVNDERVEICKEISTHILDSYSTKTNHMRENILYSAFLGGVSQVTNVDEISHIVISAVHTQPVAVALNTWLHDNTRVCVDAITFLSDCYTNSHITICCLKRDLQRIEEFTSLCSLNDKCSIAVVPPKYPSENRFLQWSMITGQPVSAIDGMAASERMFFDMPSLILFGRALCQHQPPTDILLPVYCADPEIRTIMQVPVGTCLKDLLSFLQIDTQGKRIIAGGLLTGDEITDSSYMLTRSTTSLTIVPETIKRSFMWFLRPGRDLDSYTKSFAASVIPVAKKLTTGTQGSLRACINCGYCAEVCPAGLYPHLLYNDVTHDLLEEALEKQIDRCIDCGLCSYVCPSKIPLATTLREAKKSVYTECAHLMHNRDYAI